MIQGIDVAHYQGDVDWVKVAAQGIDWVGFKVTEGDGFIDPTWAANADGTQAAGIRHRLGYHWLSHNIDVDRQVGWFLRTFYAANPLPEGVGVMLDVEEAGCTEDMVLRWCEGVEAHTGRPVAVYTGVFFAGGSIWESELIYNAATRRPRVLAAYVDEAKARFYASPWWADAWQYTSSGQVDGVPTRVDMDRVDNPGAFDDVCGYVVPEAIVTELTNGDDEMLLLDYNGLILVTDYFIVKRIKSGDTVAGPTIPRTKAQITALLGDVMYTDGPSPFSGIPGYEDPELDGLWNARPQAQAAATLDGESIAQGIVNQVVAKLAGLKIVVEQ